MRSNPIALITSIALLASISLYSIELNAQDRAYARGIVETLCSPEFNGRGYYAHGDSTASDFIAREFIKIGLQPFETINDEATNTVEQYLQEFRHPVNAINGYIAAGFAEKPKRIAGWPLKAEAEDSEEREEKARDKKNSGKLEAGVDYLIDPSSPTYDDVGKLLVLSEKEHISIKSFTKVIGDLDEKFIVLDQSYLKDKSAEERETFNEIRGFLMWNGELEIAGLIELVDKLTFTASPQTSPNPYVTMTHAAFKEGRESAGEYFQLKLESTFTERYLSRNVVGYIEGQNKDSFVCVVAHYDHLGRMGHDVYFPGANDNASGVAMMLSLAKDHAAKALSQKPKYNMVFIAFGAEEIGLVGSRYFVSHSPFLLEQIKFLINLDILGTGEEGIQVVNGKVHEQQFARLQSLNASQQSKVTSETAGNASALLAQVKTRGPACNSDHCYFHEANVPSFFIYTLGGVRHYHDVFDKSETLPLTEFEDLFTLLTHFIAGL